MDLAHPGLTQEADRVVNERASERLANLAIVSDSLRNRNKDKADNTADTRKAQIKASTMAMSANARLRTRQIQTTTTTQENANGPSNNQNIPLNAASESYLNYLNSRRLQIRIEADRYFEQLRYLNLDSDRVNEFTSRILSLMQLGEAVIDQDEDIFILSQQEFNRATDQDSLLKRDSLARERQQRLQNIQEMETLKASLHTDLEQELRAMIPDVVSA